MNKLDSILNKLVYFVLIISVIGYLFSTLLPYFSNPGFESTVANWIVRWVLIILLVIITLILFAVKRTLFYTVGFFFVSIAASFQIFKILLTPSAILEVLVHFYVLMTSIHFMTRDLRRQRRPRRRRNKKPADW